MKNYLQDKDFLYQLNQYQHKEIYAQIVALSFDEQPLETIEGRVTSGSINIDGNSTVRRTCNLTLIAKDVNITDFYWGVSNKFTLNIGVKNFINNNYPDIIWFKQGIYVISSFNMSLTNNNYTISIGGKDKMCLLNGDIGGNLPASIDFGTVEETKYIYTKVNIENFSDYQSGKYYIYNPNTKKYDLCFDSYNSNKTYYTKDAVKEKKQLPIKNIILEAVHTYGKEAYQNIIIDNLDDMGLELLQYRGDKDFYLLYDELNGIYDQIVLYDDYEVGEEIDQKGNIISPGKKVKISNVKEYNNAIEANDFNSNRSRYILNVNGTNMIYSVTKVSNSNQNGINDSSAIGYRLTDLVYAGDLISSVGESLTSILDKIKNMLGSFEYFYDLDGKFVFQAKKIYSQSSWNSLVETDGNIFARDAIEDSPYSYSFEDVNLIQQFTNTPAISNVKNDYSIWGVRKSVTGQELPIHARYAINEKPEYYKSMSGKIYCTDENMFETIKQSEKDKIVLGVLDRIKNFKPKYEVKEGLQPPERHEDGSWGPGWWDIRDWYDYYYALRQKAPNGTMKWYSHNSIEGCVPAETVSSKYAGKNNYVWLIIVESDGDINIQHGNGNPENPGEDCQYYESYLDPDAPNGFRTVKKNEVKYFMNPYCGCSDTHTYLEFLKNDIEKKGSLVYFYNPNFPGADSFDDAVQDQIDKEIEDMINNGTLNKVDWREIIYQMAIDYFKHNQEDDFLYKISENNKITPTHRYYINGETGYEIFYTDMQGFWRQLYNPEPIKTFDTSGGNYIEEKFYRVVNVDENNLTKYYIGDADKKIFSLNVENKTGQEYYTLDKDSPEATEIFRMGYRWINFIQDETFSCDYFLKPKENSYAKQKINKNNFSSYENNKLWIKDYGEYIPLSPGSGFDATKSYYLLEKDDNNNFSSTNYYWHKNIVLAPQLLNFWIDFYQGEDTLSQYKISSIGDRAKVVNDSKITSVYFREIPQVIFVKKDEFDTAQIKSGYTYIYLTDEMGDLFSISSRGKSAEQEMEDLFNKYSYCTESITISTIPIYHLEPNTLIHIKNEENNLNGKYQISKITVPLTYNGMMTISATKIVDMV